MIKRPDHKLTTDFASVDRQTLKRLISFHDLHSTDVEKDNLYSKTMVSLPFRVDSTTGMFNTIDVDSLETLITFFETKATDVEKSTISNSIQFIDNYFPFSWKYI